MTEREEDGHRTVKADHDGDVGRLVESEQLDVLEDLAAPVAGVPLYRRRPHSVGHVAEEGDDQVGDGQVKYQQVDVRFLDRSGAVRSEAQQLGDREGVSGERDQKHDAEYRRLDERHLVKLRREDIIDDDDDRRISRDRLRHPGGGGGGSFRRFHRVYHRISFYSIPESILRFARRFDYAQKEVYGGFQQCAAFALAKKDITPYLLCCWFTVRWQQVQRRFRVVLYCGQPICFSGITLA